jgi:mannose-6-phosphate isomerase
MLDMQQGFPLLIKLLDCADWLSVQVHPNDEQARQMVGPGERGKTEAWHLLEAEPGAELIAGVKGGFIMPNTQLNSLALLGLSLDQRGCT